MYLVALRIHHFFGIVLRLESHPDDVVPSGNYENLLKKTFPCWSFEITLVPQLNQGSSGASTRGNDNANPRLGADLDEGPRQGGVSLRIWDCTISPF